MGELASFLENLFSTGRVRLERRPDASEAERREAVPALHQAFMDDLMELPGPAPKFDPVVAVAAAEWTRRACWFLLSRTELGEVVEQALTLPRPPGGAGQHLAADVTFRYLPMLHQRARALAPHDLLTRRLADVLRQWPLSGVLADLHEPPIGSLDFDGHPGLQMRYAERLAQNGKPAWLPPAGSTAASYVELVSGKAPRLVAPELVDD